MRWRRSCAWSLSMSARCRPHRTLKQDLSPADRLDWNTPGGEISDAAQMCPGRLLPTVNLGFLTMSLGLVTMN